MNEIIKRWISYLSVSMLGVVLFSNSVFAVDACKVSTAVTAIKKVDEKQYVIPLYIHNNQGIMGFRIDLHCDTKKVKILSITKGLVTAKGNFTSNVTLEQENADTSVLWNTTENTTEDGTIMYVGIEILEQDIESIDIAVNYSQSDTFDEQWKDVVLHCDSISFTLQRISDGNSEAGDDEMNELIENKDEVQYQNQAILNISNTHQYSAISEAKIKSALVRTLKKYKAASLSNIPEGEETQFWEDVKADLKKNEKVKKSQLKDLELPQIAEMITITREDFDEEYIYEAQPAHKLNKNIYIISIIVLVFGFIVILYGKRRRKSEKE